ncbi:Synaptonemal complex protein 1 [Fagus crenata]
MARRSSGRSAPRAAPRRAPVRNPPQTVNQAPPPAPVQSGGGGSILGGIGSTIAQGMAFGTGSAVAHRAVDAVMGPRTIQHETVASEAAALESENKDNLEKFQSEIQRKAEEIDILQKDSEKHTQHVDLLEKQISQLHNLLKEKEQLILQCKEQETKLEDQVKENQGLLTAAESKLAEAKNQYDQMLESKQLELSRHLKEIS